MVERGVSRSSTLGLAGFLTVTQTQIQVPAGVDTLLHTTTECLRFVTEFFEVISQSAPHIYHSALQLVPHSSMVRKLYSQQIHSPMPRVVTGIPTSWDSCTASASVASKVGLAVWSPCGQFVAVCFGDDIEVRDPNTLEILSILKAPLDDAKSALELLSTIGVPLDAAEATARSLCFSPDGRLLACSYPFPW